MKKTLLMLALALIVSLANSQSATVPVKLVWTANPVAEGVTFYTVYEGSTILGTVPAGPSPQYVIPPLDGSPHTYSVTASNGFFESSRSSVAAPVSPAPPSGLGIARLP